MTPNQGNELVIALKNELAKAQEIIRQQDFAIERMRKTEIAVADANVRIAELYEELETAHEELIESREFTKMYHELHDLNQKIRKQSDDLFKSMHHAYKIQAAVFKDFSITNRLLPSSFVYLQPRDIVSGDFYFSTVKNGKIFIAAADCTGHGVPAAFTSLLGFFYLHQLVDYKGFTDPAKILTELHKGISKTFEDEDHMRRDGMDIAICVIDKKTGTVEYASAKRPLIYFSEGVMTQIKGTPKSIGSSDEYFKEPYETHQILLGDENIAIDTCFYMFSDGYPDLFGGENFEKFSIKNFRNLLENIHREPLEKQHEILKNTYNSWKGDKVATDDVLVIGFKVFETI